MNQQEFPVLKVL